MNRICSVCKEAPRLSERVARCRACENARIQEWKRNAATSPEYRKRMADQARNLRESNPELRERERQSSAANYAKNGEACRAASLAWKKANPERHNAHHRKWKHTKRANGGTYLVAEWFALIDAQEGRCVACGIECKLTVDHIVPVSRGGSNSIGNIQGLCLSCNCSKKNLTMREFLERQAA